MMRSVFCCTSSRPSVLTLLLFSLLFLIGAAPSWAMVTLRASAASPTTSPTGFTIDGVPANNHSDYPGYEYPMYQDISATPDGRYIAYYSRATNLVPLSSSVLQGGNVYRYDTIKGETECASVFGSGGLTQVGTAPDSGYCGIYISPNGRYIIFNNKQTVTGGTAEGLYLRDMQTQTTTQLANTLPDSETGTPGWPSGISPAAGSVCTRYNICGGEHDVTINNVLYHVIQYAFREYAFCENGNDPNRTYSYSMPENVFVGEIRFDAYWNNPSFYAPLPTIYRNYHIYPIPNCPADDYTPQQDFDCWTTTNKNESSNSGLVFPSGLKAIALSPDGEYLAMSACTTSLPWDDYTAPGSTDIRNNVFTYSVGTAFCENYYQMPQPTTAMYPRINPPCTSTTNPDCSYVTISNALASNGLPLVAFVDGRNYLNVPLPGSPPPPFVNTMYTATDLDYTTSGGNGLRCVSWTSNGSTALTTCGEGPGNITPDGTMMAISSDVPLITADTNLVMDSFISHLPASNSQPNTACIYDRVSVQSNQAQCSSNGSRVDNSSCVYDPNMVVSPDGNYAAYASILSSLTNDDTLYNVVGVFQYRRNDFLPELMIKNDGDSSYIGQNDYRVQDQVKQQTVNNNATVTYNFKLQNNYPSQTVTYCITSSTTLQSGWSVQYWDALTGGTNITANVTSTSGWVTTLLPGATKEFRVQVTPNGIVPQGQRQSIVLRATPYYYDPGTQSNILWVTAHDDVQYDTIVSPAILGDTTTELVSVDNSNNPGTYDSGNSSQLVLISPDGTLIAFDSMATNITGDLKGSNGELLQEVCLRDPASGKIITLTHGQLGTGYLTQKNSYLWAVSNQTSYGDWCVAYTTNTYDGPKIAYVCRYTSPTSFRTLRIDYPQAPGDQYWPSTFGPMAMSADGNWLACPATTLNNIYGFYLYKYNGTSYDRVASTLQAEPGNGGSYGPVLVSPTELTLIPHWGVTWNGSCCGASFSEDGHYLCYVYSYTDVFGLAQQVIVRMDLQRGYLIECVNCLADGTPANGVSGLLFDASRDGRFVSFVSSDTNLISGMPYPGIRVKDMGTGSVTADSNLPTNQPPPVPPYINIQDSSNGNSFSMSAGGRYLAFSAGNAGYLGLTVRDRLLSTYTLAATSVTTGNAFFSRSPSISDDGTAVAFASADPNVVRVNTNGCSQVYLHHRSFNPPPIGKITNISSSIGSFYLNSHSCSVSGDGKYVAFISDATVIPSLGNNTHRQAYLCPRNLDGTITPGNAVCVSLLPNGTLGTGDCCEVAVNGDGSNVAFVAATTTGCKYDPDTTIWTVTTNKEVYLRNVAAGTTVCCTRNWYYTGFPPFPSKTCDGDCMNISFTTGTLVFASNADNLCGDAGWWRVYKYIPAGPGQSAGVHCYTAGTSVNGDSGRGNVMCSSDGYIVFDSNASTLISGDPTLYDPQHRYRNIFKTGGSGVVRISVPTIGQAETGDSCNPSIINNPFDSTDRIAYLSKATNIGVTNNTGVYQAVECVIINPAGTIGAPMLVSTNAGAPANSGGVTGIPLISQYGDHVLFMTNAANFPYQNGYTQLYDHNLVSNQTNCLTLVSNNGIHPGGGNSGTTPNIPPYLSPFGFMSMCNGGVVIAFPSQASNLDPKHGGGNTLYIWENNLSSP